MKVTLEAKKALVQKAMSDWTIETFHKGWFATKKVDGIVAYCAMGKLFWTETNENNWAISNQIQLDFASKYWTNISYVNDTLGFTNTKQMLEDLYV